MSVSKPSRFTDWGTNTLKKYIYELEAKHASDYAALLERCEKMEKALKRAADMIESDFCSHGTPHGDVSACFANFIYAALASKEKPSV